MSATQGASLAVASAKDVVAHGVKKSCTVFIGGQKKCVRDGGRWYDCAGGSDTQAFIKQICDAYKAETGAASQECIAALGGGDKAT